jgi:hypothetical protein
LYRALFLLKSNALLAFSGAVLSWIFGIQAQWKLANMYAIFVFFAVLAVYNLHRYYKLLETTDAAYGNKNNYAAIGALSAVIALTIFLFVVADTTTVVVFAFLSLISIWYVYPLFGCKLREIKWMKGLFVAFVWTAVVAGVPFLDAASAIYFRQLTGLFFFLFALTIPFDIRDLQKDGPDKLTLPQLVGVRWSKRLSLIFFSLGIVLALWIQPAPGAILAAAAIILVFWFLLWFLSPKSPRLHYALFDLLLMAYAGLLLLVN